MKLSHRGLVAALVGAVALVSLTACSGSSTGGGGSAASSAQPIHVNVGYNGDGNGAMLEAIAEKQGIWKKHGLDVSAKQFTNGPLQIQALGTGDLDFGFIGPGALWLPMSGKAKIVAIEALGTADRVIAQKGITSMKDLKGKTVGVPEGTSGDMLLSLALANAGMSATDIKKVAMDAPTAIAAFTAGQIDAAAIWYPFVDQIKQHKPDMVEVAKSADFPDLAFPSSIVAGNDIASKPEMLKRYQAGIKEAMTWAAAHKSELPQLLSTFLKAPLESVKSEFAYVDVQPPKNLIEKWDSGIAPKWFENLNSEFIRMKKLDKAVDPHTYILFEEYKKA
ncbi:aliphatic sulfonate ABC transporter substrate-binding protein [Microbacterium panaciterrae]|uniref:Aliphatic sulfonate ABC transporter substrate-binding protein n=1 Tax=Microbacterium panaciterrae TaxID=985759 RepID=A0ABP8PFE3_9MICO